MSQLEHWAEISDKVTAVEEFLSWLEAKYNLGFDFDIADKGTPLELKQLIYNYFEVDRAKLEKERRELLNNYLAKQNI